MTACSSAVRMVSVGTSVMPCPDSCCDSACSFTERKEKKKLRHEAFDIEKLEMIPNWAQATLGCSFTLLSELGNICSFCKLVNDTNMSQRVPQQAPTLMGLTVMRMMQAA